MSTQELNSTSDDEGLFKRLLSTISLSDVEILLIKGREYGDSWKRRGGVGAFMMLARKWDRIEEQVRRKSYDVFEACTADDREEGILDDIGDLRRYLLLVEQEVRHARDPFIKLVDEHAHAAAREEEAQSMREHAASIRSQCADGAPIWTAQDKWWALTLISNIPCRCAHIGDGEYVECERCSFLRKFGGMR